MNFHLTELSKGACDSVSPLAENGPEVCALSFGFLEASSASQEQKVGFKGSLNSYGVRIWEYESSLFPGHLQGSCAGPRKLMGEDCLNGRCQGVVRKITLLFCFVLIQLEFAEHLLSACQC